MRTAEREVEKRTLGRMGGRAKIPLHLGGRVFFGCFAWAPHCVVCPMHRDKRGLLRRDHCLRAGAGPDGLAGAAKRGRSTAVPQGLGGKTTIELMRPAGSRDASGPSAHSTRRSRKALRAVPHGDPAASAGRGGPRTTSLLLRLKDEGGPHRSAQRLLHRPAARALRHHPGDRFLCG